MGLRHRFNARFRPWANPAPPPDPNAPHKCNLPIGGHWLERYQCPVCGQRWIRQRTLFSSTPYYRTEAAPWPEIGTRKVHAGNNVEYTHHWAHDEDAE